MKRRRSATERNREHGLVITLVAVVLLFVVGAMAVLAIDVATFYTARSEAQLAADAGALAGARVLANSGTTSDPANTNLATNAQTLAKTIATQVAQQNAIGGKNQNTVVVTINATGVLDYDPQITVQVTRSDLPTFFARVFGKNVATVTASATAEAYNPSGSNGSIGSVVPVAPTCVKPWVLPNAADSAGDPIFDSTTGAILTTSPLGSVITLNAACSDGGTSPPCGSGTVPATAWSYFPGDPTSSFLTPTQALPACSAGLSSYEVSIAGCVQEPIVCGGPNSDVNLYTSYVPANTTGDADAAEAANCLTHSQNGNGDSWALPAPWDAQTPFQFLAGADNPAVKPAGTDVIVSDSLVIIPVATVPGGTWSSPATVIGFVQVFLNPSGGVIGTIGVPATITNLVGCGTGAKAKPIIYGNGPSAVAVRLIHQ